MADLPGGLLDVYRDATWLNPVSPAVTVNRLVAWLDEHPVDAAALLPGLVKFVKDRRDL